MRGELLDKAMHPDPRDTGVDCKLALQIPVAFSCGGVACFYPTPLEQDLLDDLGILDHEDLVKEDPQLTMMQPCYKTSITIAQL